MKRGCVLKLQGVTKEEPAVKESLIHPLLDRVLCHFFLEKKKKILSFIFYFLFPFRRRIITLLGRYSPSCQNVIARPEICFVTRGERPRLSLPSLILGCSHCPVILLRFDESLGRTVGLEELELNLLTLFMAPPIG